MPLEVPTQPNRDGPRTRLLLTQMHVCTRIRASVILHDDCHETRALMQDSVRKHGMTIRGRILGRNSSPRHQLTMSTGRHSGSQGRVEEAVGWPPVNTRRILCEQSMMRLCSGRHDRSVPGRLVTIVNLGCSASTERETRNSTFDSIDQSGGPS
jgi:hypothetical protein